MPKYRIPQLKLRPDHERGDVERKILAILGQQKASLVSWKIDRKSFDAREKTDIKIIYGVTAELRNAARGQGAGRDWFPAEDGGEYSFPHPRAGSSPAEEAPAGTSPHGSAPHDSSPHDSAHSAPSMALDSRKHAPNPAAPARSRPVVVGSGPAGLFCALILAENGYAPLVLERGEEVGARQETVRRFWETGELDPDSNMQFGEGGAGTFSDGKLNTSIADREGLNAKVLREFVDAGAPPEIAYIAKPHIGTDYLVDVVATLRKKIESLGGTVRFGAKVTSFGIEGGTIRTVTVNGREEIDAPALALAIGHSARDSFEELARGPVALERKPFAIGLRIEHPQEMIQRNQFGPFWNHPKLPVADYKLTHKLSDGRGVYSFCMCPGGFVVNSSSEPGMVACNGMSDFARSERNANSAIVVAVRTEDFGSGGALAGIDFQRKWERAAYLAVNDGMESARTPGTDGSRVTAAGASRDGGGDYSGRKRGFAMPVQRYADFLAGVPSTRFGTIRPCAKGLYRFADLNACLPDFVLDGIKEGIGAFERKIPGFAHPDAILTGVETRTSSPVRILRDESFQSSVRGVFPCGEGAGYAGGIMSAAMDGIRVAEAIARAIGEGGKP